MEIYAQCAYTNVILNYIMKKIITLFLILSISQIVLAQEIDSTECQYAISAQEAFKCGNNAKSIMIGYEQWPKGKNSTDFFNVIKNNKKLEILSFCGLQIDSLPSFIGSLTSLKKLELGGGQNIKVLPKEIGNLTNLEELLIGNECQGNKISELPKEIGNCTSLKILDLSFNKINSLPDELKNCENLTKITIMFNIGMTKEILAEFRSRFPKITFISELGDK